MNNIEQLASYSPEKRQEFIRLLIAQVESHPLTEFEELALGLALRTCKHLYPEDYQLARNALCPC